MKHPVRYAALTMLALGGVGLVLRRLLYSLALDEKNLLPLGHPLEIILWVLTAAAAAAVVIFCLRIDKNLTLRSGGGLVMPLPCSGTLDLWESLLLPAYSLKTVCFIFPYLRSSISWSCGL